MLWLSQLDILSFGTFRDVGFLPNHNSSLRTQFSLTVLTLQSSSSSSSLRPSKHLSYGARLLLLWKVSLGKGDFNKRTPATRKMPNVNTQTSVWIQFDCPFHPECCVPNGPFIYTPNPRSSQVSFRNYLSSYLLSNPSNANASFWHCFSHLPYRLTSPAHLKSSLVQPSSLDVVVPAHVVPSSSYHSSHHPAEYH